MCPTQRAGRAVRAAKDRHATNRPGLQSESYPPLARNSNHRRAIYDKSAIQ